MKKFLMFMLVRLKIILKIFVIWVSVRKRVNFFLFM